ncbi:unnamed protein product, partial [Closterium sp. NIES-53]
ARGSGDAGAGGAGVTTGAGGTGGTAAAGPRAGDPTEPGAAGVGGTGAGGAGAGGAGAAGAGGVDSGAGGAGDTVRPRPYFVPLLQQVLGVPSSTSLTPPLLCPPPDQSQLPLQPTSPLPAPSPYTEQSSVLTERREPGSRPVLHVRTARRVPRSRPPPVPDTHAMALRPSSVPLRVSLPAPPESSLPDVPDHESDRARAASPTVARLLTTAVIDPSFESAAASALVAEQLDFAAACRLDYTTALVAQSEQEEFECLAAAVPRFTSMLFAPEGDPDAPDIPTPRSYAEAITGPYSSQWQAAMDAEMVSWKSTSTYIDEVPPPWANIVDGMWIFRVKRPPGSPPAFKACYVARGFSQQQGVDYFQTFSPTPKMTTLRVLLHVAAQRDYELHSLDFSTAFLQGSLHEEIWLRRPPEFSGSFPAGTQWSLRRPVYGLRQAPREWHDTLRTTLAALGFAPSTADLLLFLRTDTSLPPFYVLVYVDGLVFATGDTEALTLVKFELQKRHTCTDLGEVLQRFGFQFSSPQPNPLSTGHSLSAPPSDESVEPSGLYPELVGCLMYLMTCTRPDLAYPLSLLARYVAPIREAWGSCLEDGVQLSSLVTQMLLGSICEAEIYAEAMAAQELRWLTYLLTDFGEQPRSPPVLYVDSKAMIALCQEHRLEHRTKHIALRYFLTRELQQRGQLCLAYVATRANTTDVFTKALPPSDCQRFSTVLGLLALLYLTVGSTRLIVDGGPVDITNVVHVPGLKVNLLSVTQLAKKGMKVTIDDAKIILFWKGKQFVQGVQEWALEVCDNDKKRIKAIRTDGGGEFMNAELEKWMKSKGIKLDVTKPSTPQLNGASEQLNRTLVEAVRSLLQHSKLGSKWWGEGSSLAAWIRNRLPTKVLPGTTPFEAWTGTKPNLSRLRTFGCLCYYHVLDPLRHKLQPKGRAAIYLGIAANERAWRVWDLGERRVVTSRDVVFDEDKFPTKE